MQPMIRTQVIPAARRPLTQIWRKTVMMFCSFMKVVVEKARISTMTARAISGAPYILKKRETEFAFFVFCIIWYLQWQSA